MKTKKTATKRRAPSPKPTEKALALTEMGSKTDLNGSYTGKPEHGIPVQDADDL